MNRISRIKRRQLLNGWIKWTILPMILFGVFFFDAWLNIQIRLKDYELAGLNTEARQLESSLATQTSRLAQLRGIENLTMEAQRMRLSAPDIHQFHAIAYREVPKRLSVMRLNTFELAQTAPPMRTLELCPPEIQESRAEELQVADNKPYMAPIDPVFNSDYPVMVTYSEPLPLREKTVLSGTPKTADPRLQDDPDLSLLTIEDMLAKL